MKNHLRVNGQLLQTNKKYSALKQKQKEQINQWLKVETEAYYHFCIRDILVWPTVRGCC